jgi:DNA repair exonuclease SbcCD ATPase subunit
MGAHGWKRVVVLSLALVTTTGCGDGDSGESAGQASGAAPPAADEPVAGDAERYWTEVRTALDALVGAADRLEAELGAASGEAAQQWRVTRPRIQRARQRLEEAIVEMRGTVNAEDRADELRAEVARRVGTLTQEVERARIAAIESREELADAVRTRLDEIEIDVRSLENAAQELSSRAQGEVAEAVAHYRSRIEVLEHQINSMTGDELDQAQERLAEEIAALSASVQRAWFDVRRHTIPSGS